MKAFDSTELYFNRAADQIELSENIRRLLLTPKREVQVQVAIERDNGEIATYIGYRVQHDDARGPMKGGLRYHPGRRFRRSPLAGRADDLEDGRGQHSLRRSQRGHRHRSGSTAASANWSGSLASSSTAFMT